MELNPDPRYWSILALEGWKSEASGQQCRWGDSSPRILPFSVQLLFVQPWFSCACLLARNTSGHVTTTHS